MMVYKYGIGDFPLKVYPCKYWWVRYTVACTFFTEKLKELWKPRLEELKKQYGFSHFSWRGKFNPQNCRTEEDFKALFKSEISIYKDGKEIKVEATSPLWNDLAEYIIAIESIGWIKCPYENDDQSKCPFYEPDPRYKDKSLEELRSRKGYEV